MRLPSAVTTAANAYLKSKGLDVDISNPSLSDVAKTALTAYLVSLGVPAPIAGRVSNAVVDKLVSKDTKPSDLKPPKLSIKNIRNKFKKSIKDFFTRQKTTPQVAEKTSEDMTQKTEQSQEPTPAPEEPPTKVQEPPELETFNPGTVNGAGDVDNQKLDHVVRPYKNEQLANEAVDIDRKTKDAVKGFRPQMNWWDQLPDWPVYSYTSIIMDQTRAAKKQITDDIGLSNDEIEQEIESRKYPYKTFSVESLQKGFITPGSTEIIVGHEIIQKANDKDTVKDTDPKTINLNNATIADTTQSNTKYEPIEVETEYPDTLRDDLTDQKNPALDLVDTQKLVDEFLDIGKRIYDSQSENPTIFGFDNVNSKYEKDKNLFLAHYKQYKANVREMEYINNIIENNSNKYLIKTIHYRHDVVNFSMEEEFWTRYLREKLLAWYNETDDPETKTWDDYHWLPGEPGKLEKELTNGGWEWFNNLAAGLEDSLARLEDIEAIIDIIASMANAQGIWQKYKDAVEIAEIQVENPEFKDTVLFTDEIIDQTMLKWLIGVPTIIGDIGGILTPLRAALEGAREANQGLLEDERIMTPAPESYPIIWETLNILCSQVNSDIFGPLNTLILDKKHDFETEGKHSSPSHLALDISTQLAGIVDTVMKDVINIVVDEQGFLPQQGLHRLDSMLNKINEIRMKGPPCAIPFHYQVAIDNVNAAERLYNDIWSDVFDCWEREYITRVWRVVYEHHLEGVIPSSNYGKPIFSAECPHHLPLLEAPVPVSYRDEEINYLSANCRKNFNFMTSWLTSALYAIGVKRVALGNVINDTSLNGDDANIPWLAQLNVLNQKNIIIKKEMDNVIAAYNGTNELVEKAKFDKVIAAKELSPRLYDNQVLLNLSSELHLLDASPVTELKVATNENRTGTTVSASPVPEWDPHVAPAQPPSEIISAKEVKAGESKIGTTGVVDEKTAAGEVVQPEPVVVNPIITLENNTIMTNGGDAEIIDDFKKISSDNTLSMEGSWVGDIDELEPWHYMDELWETQRIPPKIPIVPPPEPAPVIPGVQEILDPKAPPPLTMNVPSIEQPPKVVTKVPENEKETVPENKGKTILNIRNTMNLPVDNMDESAKAKLRGINAFQQRLWSIISSNEEDEETRKK